MNTLHLINSYFESIQQKEKDRTDMTAVHLVFTCLLLDYDENDALKIAKTSARVFQQIAKDASGSEIIEFNLKSYIKKFMNFYYFVVTECLLDHLGPKELFKSTPEWKNNKNIN